MVHAKEWGIWVNTIASRYEGLLLWACLAYLYIFSLSHVTIRLLLLPVSTPGHPRKGQEEKGSYGARPFLGSALYLFEEVEMEGKAYYCTPGGFLYRKDAGSAEAGGFFCGYLNDDAWHYRIAD